MKEAVKEFKKLCRDYGVNLGENDLYKASGKPKRTRRRGLTMDSERDEELSSASSNDEIAPSEGQSEGLGNHARWNDVQYLLNELQTRKRIRAVKEISRALDDSADRAETELRELDALEQSHTEGKEAAEEEQPETPEVSAEQQTEDELLNFRASDMKVVQALRRCIEFVPELKKRVDKKAAERKSMLSMMRADDDLEEDLPTHNSSSADDAETEEQPQQKSIIHDVNRKLRCFGDLRRDAPQDLSIVLEAQRLEIRALAARIDEGERKVKTQRLALDYIDNNVDTAKVDPELLRAAISTTQNMRANILKTRREEEERRMRNERLERNMPSEVEVQDCMDECERLKEESERATERVERLLEFTASTASAARQSLILGETPPAAAADVLAEAISGDAESPGSFDGDSPSPTSQLQVPPGAATLQGPAPSGGRRRAVRAAGLLQPAPQLEVSHEKAPELHKQLKGDVAKLDGEIQEQQNRISNSEVTMRNAETTLKVLEETKTLFLEHIAREKPSLLGDLGLIADDEDEADNGDGSDLESEEEPFESRGIAETLSILEGEEAWLRMELDMASSQFEEDAESPKTLDPDRLSTPGDQAVRTPQEAEEESTFVDVRKLAVRVEQQIRNLKSEKDQTAEDNEESSTEDVDSRSAESEGSQKDSFEPDLSSTSWSANRNEDVQKLLELRHENAKLLQNIKEAQEELKDLRESTGAPGTSLIPGMPSLEPEADTEAGVAYVEVQRKQRELLALRKRWWSERQDPQTTVRRALAVAELPLQRAKKEEEEEDPENKRVEVPPTTEQNSLFQRIYTSMTIA